MKTAWRSSGNAERRRRMPCAKTTSEDRSMVPASPTKTDNSAATFAAAMSRRVVKVGAVSSQRPRVGSEFVRPAFAGGDAVALGELRAYHAVFWLVFRGPPYHNLVRGKEALRHIAPQRVFSGHSHWTPAGVENFQRQFHLSSRSGVSARGREVCSALVRFRRRGRSL